MGNENGKMKDKSSLLTKDELKLVQTAFKHISRNTTKIKDDDLIRVWSSQIDPRLCKFVSNYLFGHGERRTQFITFETFAELFVYSVRGTTEERISVFLSSLGLQHDENEVPYHLIKEYVESIIASYIKVLKLQDSPSLVSWSSGGFLTHNEYLLRFSESLAHTIGNPRNRIQHADLSKWFSYSPSVTKMLSHIFTHVYRYTEHTKSTYPQDNFSSFVNLHDNNTEMLPICTGLDFITDYQPIIDIAQLLFISSNLPTECQKEWRFLFSSHVHGNSFNTLLGRILEQGPTVFIVEDEDGHIFGGFATDSWVVSPKFFGKNTSFLFTLAPKMRIYPSTTYNDHYQYLNTYQQTMPNGLGMGGQFNFWGFFLSDDYGVGQSSESCTTYKDYQQLSKLKDFKVKSLEVWAVDEAPKTAEELGERRNSKKGRSVLVGNEENKAILEMAGKQHYSEGLIEDPDCQ